MTFQKNQMILEQENLSDAQLAHANLRNPQENYSDVMKAYANIGVVFICAHYI
jgi:hypothetical protein